jgi:hypothetical protein
MKLNKIAVISAAILVTLLAGAIAFNTFGAVKDLKLKVKWRPVTYTLGNPVPDPWNAEIFFAPIRDLNEIDTSTLLLEGMYTPSGTPTLMTSSPPRMSVPFDGDDVLRALMSKMSHMGPGTYQVFLEISGNLKPEYGGTPFSGIGGIDLIVPDVSPP